MAARAHQLLDCVSLAKRLEPLSANAVARLVDAGAAIFPELEAVWFRSCGAVVAYMGPGSPMNHVVGLGISGGTDEGSVSAMESFYSSRDERGLAAVAEVADPDVLRLLRSRGWRLDGYENVLVRSYVPGESFVNSGRIEVVEAVSEADRDDWALAAATGFSAPDDPLKEQLEVSAAAAASRESRLFMAIVDGLIAGVGELCVAGGVAWLSADTTLPGYRRRGIQQELQRVRLAAGAEADCDIAVSEAAPDSGSQRNMERLGFEVAYRRLDLLASTRPIGATG